LLKRKITVGHRFTIIANRYFPLSKALGANGSVVLKSRDPKVFFFLLVPFVAIVSFLANVDKKSAIDFEANGMVVIAKWYTRNHNMHLFVIKQNTPAQNERKWESSGIILTSEQIKFGDQFRKEKGSKFCFINNIRIRCLK